MMVLEHARTIPGGDFPIITLDVEKAFDNVSFDWISLVLAKMGFSGPFTHLIKSIYTFLTDRLVVAGLLTEEFGLYKGTTQECLLSPLLFNLALELLSKFLTDKAPYMAST